MLNWLFPTYNRRLTLSLSGISQSAALVYQLANTGLCEPAAFKRCRLALLETDPENDDQIFGSMEEMSLGLAELKSFCDGNVRDRTTLQYQVQIMHLQKLLAARDDVLDKVAAGLKRARQQLEMYGDDSQGLTGNLGQLYQDTLSTLGFRIQVKGQPQYLEQDIVAAKVRLLLFSGVRFAFLWHQSGGRTHHLITSKTSIAREIRACQLNPDH